MFLVGAFSCATCSADWPLPYCFEPSAAVCFAGAGADFFAACSACFASCFAGGGAGFAAGAAAGGAGFAAGAAAGGVAALLACPGAEPELPGVAGGPFPLPASAEPVKTASAKAEAAEARIRNLCLICGI